MPGTRIAWIVALGLGFAATPALATDPDKAGMARLFKSLEKGIREADQPLFKRGWHPEGYQKNLVGGSGLPGASVYRQGTRKQWYLKADLSALRTTRRGSPFLVPCEIWSFQRNAAVDKVWAALIWRSRAWVILGAGEKLAEVEALAQRYLEKKPLEAPKK